MKGITLVKVYMNGNKRHKACQKSGVLNPNNGIHRARSKSVNNTDIGTLSLGTQAPGHMGQQLLNHTITSSLQHLVNSATDLRRIEIRSALHQFTLTNDYIIFSI